jgi:hypothetical protein
VALKKAHLIFLVALLLAAQGCRLSRRSNDDDAGIRVVTLGKELCVKSTSGGTHFYLMGKLGLYRAGVILPGQRLGLGQVLSNQPEHDGEFQVVKVILDGTQREDELLYVAASDLACKTPRACNALSRQGTGTKETQFAPKDSRPVDLRLAPSSGELENAKIVVQITENFSASKISLIDSVVATGGNIGISLKLYLKSRDKDGNELLSQTLGECQ